MASVGIPPARYPARARRLGVGAAALLAMLRAGPGAPRAQDPAVSLIRDTEIEDILHQDADPVFRAAGINPSAVQIHIIGDKEMNAFVSSGQQLFLFSGLIMETKTPNELIGVMAHETGTWPAATWRARARARRAR